MAVKRQSRQSTVNNESPTPPNAAEQPDATQAVLDDMHAEAATQAGASPSNELGQVGHRFDRRAPFFVGFTGAIGVACAVALAWVVITAGQILVLLGLAFFLAVGLDPAVVWIYRRGVPRWLAVSGVLLAALAVFAVFVVLAVPVVVEQATKLADHIPTYLHELGQRHTALGKLNAKYHLVQSLQKLLKNGATFSSALGVAKVVLDFVASMVLVIAVTIYLLADFPRVKRWIYQLSPRSRRPRMVLLTDAMLDGVGGYVLGNLLTSFIAGLGTCLWSLAFGIPYPLLLGLLVALLDLIPIIGSTIGGVIVALVALTVSLEIAIATAVFYTVYRVLEDYLLLPRVMRHTVSVPGIVTVIATIIGGALLGIIGALVAIPIAAAIKLLHDEIMTPRLEDG
jgi:predicted PurR-regulated permease PerM